MGYIQLNKDFLEKNKKKAEEESIVQIGEEEGKGKYLFTEEEFPIEDSITIEEISDSGEITVSFTNNLGYFSFQVPLDDDDLITIVGIITKKLNKFKSVLESLK